MQVGVCYWRVCIETLQREWHSIDRLRLDKYLMLVRKFVGAMLAHLAAHNWCVVLCCTRHCNAPVWMGPTLVV